MQGLYKSVLRGVYQEPTLSGSQDQADYLTDPEDAHPSCAMQHYERH